MKIVYIHSSYQANDLIGQWFSVTQKQLQQQQGNAWFAIKFRHQGSNPKDIMIGDSISCGIHARMFDYFGIQDMLSRRATKRFLKRLDEIRPDIIHCHVINDCFLNIGLFSNYVNKHQIKVVWTFHDARVLTGMCACPRYTECNQWENQCKYCPKENCIISPRYRWTNLVSFVHKYRKKTIGSIESLTIVTPSKWMQSLVKQSYLKDKSCIVINNGINLKVFRPVASDIKKQYGIPDGKKVLLSVANPIWKLKGRDYLLKLVNDLPEEYYMIFIGSLEQDVEALKSRRNVLALPRIDREELVQFYSVADLFINPTLADNFPTVNLECQACGTPIVAFDSDGTRETIDSGSGIVVERKNYEALKNAILNFRYGKKVREECLCFARQYDQKSTIQKYIQLYHSL